MTAPNRLQTSLIVLILLLTSFILFLGYTLSPKLVSAQSEKEASQDCLAAPDYTGSSYSSRFDNPRDDCSIGYYPVNYEHDRFKDFIDHATLQCVSSPRLVFKLVGDAARDADKLFSFARSSNAVSEQLSLDIIANLALGAEIEKENQDDLPVNIRILLSYFDRYNTALSQSICHQQGHVDYKSCLKEMDACLTGNGQCRENYFLTSSSLPRITSTRNQFDYYRDRCNFITASVTDALNPGLNSMDQANPREQNTWLDPYGTNLHGLCEKLPQTYEEYDANLSPKEKALYAQIPPSVSLERGFLVVSRYPSAKHSLGGFLNRNFTSPDLQIVAFYIPGLVGTIAEAKREFQLYMPLAKGQEALTKIEYLTYKPLANPVPLGDSTPAEAVIPNPSQFKQYEEFWPIIDKINQEGMVCGNANSGETQLMGAIAKTKSEGSALARWSFRLPSIGDLDSGTSPLDFLNQFINKEPVNAYSAWILLPKYFTQLQALHGGSEQALINRFLTHDQVIRKMKQIDIPQPISRSQTSVSSSIINRFNRQETCTTITDCYNDPETGAQVCVDKPDCEQGEIGVTTGDTMASSSIPGGETVHFMGLELGRRFFQKISDTREYFQSGCYYPELASRFPALNQILGREATGLVDPSKCPATLDLSGLSLSCQTHPAQLNPGVCSFDPKLGFNFGYGHIDDGACQDSAGKPVTFLVPITAAVDEINSFNTCYQNASKRIVRLTGINPSTPNDIIKNSAIALSDSKKGFSKPDDYIVFGNELNNLSAEYTGCSGGLNSCGSQYATQFKLFHDNYTGTGKLSAAPVDTLNSDYDAEPFLKGALAAYQNSDFLAANVYQAPSCAYDALRCSIDSYKWVQSIVGGGKPVILTEFGLAPGSDTNLDQVVNFIKTNIPGDVEAVTPLIRNVCSSGGEWLRFNCLDLINDKGEGVNAGSSGPPGGTGSYPSGVAGPTGTVMEYLNSLSSQYCIDPIYMHATISIESRHILNLTEDQFKAASVDGWWRGRCGPYSATASDPTCASLYCYDTCASASCEGLCQDSSGVKWAKRYVNGAPQSCDAYGWTPRVRTNPDRRENPNQSSTTVMGAGQIEEVTYEGTFLSSPRNRQPGNEELMLRCEVDDNLTKVAQLMAQFKAEKTPSNTKCDSWTDTEVWQVANRYNSFGGYADSVLRKYQDLKLKYAN